MKGIVIFVLAAGLATTASAQSPSPQPQRPQQPQQQSPQAQTNGTAANVATMKEIEQAFGFVPQFFRAIPSQMLETFWSGMQFQSSAQTALNPKTKELIGIAVAAQIPCEYCVHFHREAARAHGATEAEIKEAVGMAAMTRMGSTFLNGLDVDMAQFRKDVERGVRHMKQQAQRNPTPAPRSRSKP